MAFFIAPSQVSRCKHIHGLLQFFPQILVHGELEATQNMAEFCRVNISGSKVFSPRINETVDATTDSHIYQVRFHQSIKQANKQSVN